MDGVGKGMLLQCGIRLLQNQQDQNCSETKKYAQVHPSQGSTNKSKDCMIEAKHHQPWVCYIIYQFSLFPQVHSGFQVPSQIEKVVVVMRTSEISL